MNRLFLAILVLFCLMGCRFGPKYYLPKMQVPEKWKTEQSCFSDRETFNFWWEVFYDEQLNELEYKAMQYSPTLLASLQRIAQARAITGVAKSNLYPQVSVDPYYFDNGQLFKIYLPNAAGATGAAATPSLLANIPGVYRIHQMQYVLPVNLSYEIDLWGKLRGQYESALFLGQAQVQDYLTAFLSLTTDLATYYFNLRALTAQADLLRRTVNLRKEALNLTQQRFDSGLVTYLDVAQASLELTNTESDYFDALRQKTLQENQIALLIGEPAPDFTILALPLYSDPPCVPAGLPSEVLLNRPDIAEAERKMASDHALIGVAYASFLPSLDLTGVLGFSSPTFKDFLTWKSRFWQIGGNIGQSVFDGFRNCSNLEFTYARYREDIENYKQTVLVAFKEVEDALNNLEMQAKQETALKQSVHAAKMASQLSTDRYKRGLVNYLEVVQNERNELDAERNYLNLLGLRYQSTVQLVKALGGTLCSD